MPRYAQRIRRRYVEFISLHKPPGETARLFPRPAILHTRNLAALECQVPAWLAGVPGRVHGEHGRDVGDLDGSNAELA